MINSIRNFLDGTRLRDGENKSGKDDCDIVQQ